MDTQNTNLYSKFYLIINEIIKFKQSANLLIALSGGQDSICLLYLIQNLKTTYKYSINIEYIYVDHQWRQDSKKHIKHLINLIRTTKNQISVYEIYKVTQSELEARLWRYKILINHALQYNFNVIITGHTKTDRLETFIQNLIKGTTIDGATSLNIYRKLSNHIILLRPLMEFHRDELTWICRKNYLPIWLDYTNHNYNTKRNRIRDELIPYLHQYFNKNISNNITSFLNITSIDNEYIKQNTIKLYLLSIHPINIALNYQIIQKQHIAIQYRAIQMFFYYHFKVLLNITILQQIIYIFSQKPHKIIKIQWHNLLINIYRNWLYININ